MTFPALNSYSIQANVRLLSPNIRQCLQWTKRSFTSSQQSAVIDVGRVSEHLFLSARKNGYIVSNEFFNELRLCGHASSPIHNNVRLSCAKSPSVVM